MPQPFQILKMDRRRGNIVVSRRAVLEETPRRGAHRARRLACRKSRWSKAWSRTSPTTAPSSISAASTACCTSPTSPGGASPIRPKSSNVGQTVNVQIIKINHETQRISLGMKQLQTDPWEGVGAKYPVGAQFNGKVTNVTDYGAFVELEPGVEGLVHVSEMSWVKKNVHPDKIVSRPGSRSAGAGSRFQQAPHLARPEADAGKSLGRLRRNHPAGTVIEGEIKQHHRIRPVRRPDGDIDGMVHLSDLSWAKPGEEAVKDYKKGDASRPRCSTSTPRRSASASASSSSRPIRSKPMRPAAR